MENPVVIIDTDPLCLSALSILIFSLGFRPLAFSSGREACAALSTLEMTPLAMITEYDLALNCQAHCVIDGFRHQFGSVPVVVLTADTSLEARTALAGLGCRVLFKPTKPDEIISFLEQCRAMPEQATKEGGPLRA